MVSFLDETFPGRWVGRGGPTAWPPRSPDLTPVVQPVAQVRIPARKRDFHYVSSEAHPASQSVGPGIISRRVE
jgi:hypothetical protein